MHRTQMYKPIYGKSHALVIGINDYTRVKPLSYACTDAEAVAETLTGKFQFSPEDVVVLKESEATSANIRQQFMRFADVTEEDDRILIFFAGHGHTKPGNRGEVGFLMPHEGTPNDLSTLIRWHDLTQSADLFPAKHVLFVMDACYGGLALTRYVHPGSMRFLKDMLQRYSRQVLTAGKADEVVADSGGPRPGHSVFTGHFLDALDGAAAKADGILTANNVMAYVYDKVAKDLHSRQTPHYGPLEGDGDFIFSSIPSEVSDANPKKEDNPIVISVPSSFEEQHEVAAVKNPVERLKEYLSDPRYRIRLDDVVTSELRSVLSHLGSDAFTTNPKCNDLKAEFAERLVSYGDITKELQGMTALFGKWAGPEHRHIIENMFSRLAEINADRNGMVAFLGFRWYPTTLLMYSGGIGSLSAERYDNLASVLTAKVIAGYRNDESQAVITAAVDGMLDVQRADLFKTLPGHDRYYAAESEYVFKSLQPVLEDVLFLGKGYESLFDRFEVFRALVYADLRDRANQNNILGFWGPAGRFGWKFTSSGGGQNPYSQIRLEASRQQDSWPPLRAGLFDGSFARFNDIATRYADHLSKLGWF